MFTAILYFFGLCVVFYLLTKICDQYFVRSLDSVARRLKLSDDVTGATFMAIGTSAPEFFICVIAVLRVGAEPIGAGTILGSAIFNILVIIGASAMIAPVRSYLHWQPVVRDMLFYFGSVMLVAFTFVDGRITLLESLLYIVIYAAYLILLSRWNRWFPRGSDAGLGDVQRGLHRGEAYVGRRHTFWSRVLSPIDRMLALVFPDLDRRPGLYPATLALCVVYIVGLSWLLVDLGVGLARALYIPPVIIALTVLACGTSVADLVASLIVAKRGRMDVAVSNAFGSNIFDILLCLGIPWALSIMTTGETVTIATAHLFSTILLLFFTLVATLYVIAAQEFHLGKRAGHLLLLMYVMYLCYMIYGASFPEVLETRTLLRGIGIDPGPEAPYTLSMSFPVELPADVLALAEQHSVRMEDIDEHFTRGSGHGGQKVNKSNNCVELTHRPTGTTVRMHEHRSQHQNRVAAFTLLIQKIADAAKAAEHQVAEERFRARRQRARRSSRSQENTLRAKRLRGLLKRRRRDHPPETGELENGVGG